MSVAPLPPRAPALPGALTAVPDLTAREIISPEDILAYEHLRYRAFVTERGWVPPVAGAPGREFDRYDPRCFHLGTFDGQGALLAYLRLLPHGPHGFMLEHEFSRLLEGSVPSFGPASAELSRFALLPGQGRRRGLLAIRLLFRLFYRVAKREGLEEIYAEVEEDWLARFNARFGFGFVQVGRTHAFPDGTRTLAARTTVTAMEASLRERDPALLEWFASIE